MKFPLKKSFQTLLVVILSGLILTSARFESGPKQSQATSFNRDPFYDASCTVVYAADEEHAFGGNNEDSPDPLTMVWFLPAEEGKFGRALFGYEGFVWQGGMNDQGLFFDAMVGDQRIHVDQGDKETYPGSLPSKALESCPDVPCVIDLFEEYHAYDDWVFQFMFGDAQGNSVIIEPNVILEGGAPFQVATNFYQSLTDINNCRYCTRYWTARNLFEKNEPLSAELMRDIMDAVHLEDEYPTQYTTVYDLKAGLIYLYHFHNYSEVVIFNLEEELAQGYQAHSVMDLFPENTEFLEWAQPELDRIRTLREAYTTVELGPIFYLPLEGFYKVPEGLEAPSDIYSIDIEHGKLVLKMLPDKAWLELEPTSETDFFHVSGFQEFEITFLTDDEGEINGFKYNSGGQEYLFERLSEDELDNFSTMPAEEPAESSWLAETAQGIGDVLRSNTVKFFGIIVGLIILQSLLRYFRSLLD